MQSGPRHMQTAMSSYHLPGFTPVRRREPELPCLSPAAPTAPWTAARCHRILRPIISRLELLRKEVKPDRRDHQCIESSVVFAEEHLQAEEPASKRRKIENGGEGLPPITPVETAEPYWLRRNDADRNCRTKYSVRGAQRGGLKTRIRSALDTPARSVAPGQLTVPTPILVRAHTLTHTTEANHDAMEVDCVGDGIQFQQPEPAKRKKFRHPTGRDKLGQYKISPFESLRGSVSVTVWSLYTGLYTAIAALLKVCHKSSVNRSSGTRSLFSTCLRQIPAFIKEEKRSMMAASGRSANGSLNDWDVELEADIYTELERARTMGSEGWKPLREVVKADGFSLIGDAIRDRLFHPEFVTALVNLCIEHNSPDEAECMMDALIAANRPHRIPASLRCRLFNPDTRPAMSALLCYIESSGRRNYGYRQLTDLLRQGVIAAEWLAMKDCVPLWDTVISSICQPHIHHAEAWRFLEAALCDALELPVLGGESPRSQGERNDDIDSDVDMDHPFEAMSGDVDRRYRPRQCKPPVKDALDNTIVSLMEVLSALAMLSSGARTPLGCSASGDSSSRTARLLGIVTMVVQREMILHGMDELWLQQIGRRLATTMLASILVSGTARVDDRHDISSAGYQALWTLGVLLNAPRSNQGSRMVNAEEILDSLAESVRSIAHCCSRATPEGAPKYVKDLVGILVCLAETPAASHLPLNEQVVLSQIIVKAISRYSNDSELGEWATLLRARFARNVPNNVSTSQACFTPTAERASDQVEEELCKQFANTPAIGLQKRRRGSIDSMSEDDTPQTRRQRTAINGLEPTKYAPPKLSSMLIGKSPTPSRPPLAVPQLSDFTPLQGDHQETQRGLLFARQRPTQAEPVLSGGKKPSSPRLETVSGISRSNPAKLRKSLRSYQTRAVNQTTDDVLPGDSDSSDDVPQTRQAGAAPVTLMDLSRDSSAEPPPAHNPKPPSKASRGTRGSSRDVRTRALRDITNSSARAPPARDRRPFFRLSAVSDDSDSEAGDNGMGV